MDTCKTIERNSTAWSADSHVIGGNFPSSPSLDYSLTFCLLRVRYERERERERGGGGEREKSKEQRDLPLFHFQGQKRQKIKTSRKPRKRLSSNFRNLRNSGQFYRATFTENQRWTVEDDQDTMQCSDTPWAPPPVIDACVCVCVCVCARARAFPYNTL